MAISRKDLVDLFGEENVLAVRHEIVAALDLGPAMSCVFTEVGLPSAAARGLPPGVTPLLSVVPLERIDGPRGTRYVRFGRLLEDAAEACVDPRTGRVVALTASADDGVVIEVFVNSTLALFLEVLCLVNQMNSDQVDADREAYARAADGLYEQLSALDPPAMADGSWWAAVVEEMQLGLM